MRKIVVVGIGSRIMTDDGIGVYLAEDLKGTLSSSGLEIMVGECDFDYCVSEICCDDYVIVIDAYLSGKRFGEITVLPLCDLKGTDSGRYSMHGMHLLHSGFDGSLIGIEPYEIEYGFGLSDPLKSRYQDIRSLVYEQIKRIRRRILSG